MSNLATRATMLLAWAGLQTLPLAALAAPSTVVDVLGVYSDHAAQLVADPQALFVSHIEYANRALQNSGADFRYNLVHVQQQNWANDSGLGSTQLNSLATDNQIQRLRDEYGADLVAGLAPSTSGLCGIGYLPSGDKATQTFYSWAKQYGYSLSGHNCGGRTMAHEIGHTMGLGHSPAQDSKGSLVDWGRGWGVSGSFATIMAYTSTYNIRNAAGRIQIHSNPALSSCNAQPCGQPSNQSDGADATRALILAASQVAGWRDAVVVGPSNRPPVAADDSATTAQDTAVTVKVLANDSDPDGDALAVSSVGNPSNGQAVRQSQTNQITYTPKTGFHGQDSFSYQITDGKGASSDSATVRVTVNEVKPPPGGGDNGNLAINGDAEAGLNGWIGGWGTQLTISADAYSGKQAVQATGGRGVLVELDAPLMGDRNFGISGSLKATRPNRAYLYLRVEANGRVGYSYLSTVEIPANRWIRFERSRYVSGAKFDAAHLLLYFYPQVVGPVLVDDVRVEQK